jgi:hypothetical protein
MGLWGMTEEFFQAGLAMDPSGCGAGWARIAIAEFNTDPTDALECATRAVASNPDAWAPWFASFIAQPTFRSKGRAGALLAAAYHMLSSPKPEYALRPAFAGAVPRAKYRDALAVARARIAETTGAQAVAAGRAGGSLQRAVVSLANRLVGLGLVLVGLAIFYAMTVPGGWWCEYAISGVVAVCATFFGLPLLVTGQVRQPQ